MFFIQKIIKRWRIIPAGTSNNNEPYVGRFSFIFNRKIAPFNIFFHKLFLSDPDDMHDHPWSFISLIIKGGYWEHSEYGKKWRGVGSIAYRPAERFHRIELKDDKEAWTLCFVGPFKRDWNFLKNGKIVPGDKSLGLR